MRKCNRVLLLRRVGVVAAANLGKWRNFSGWRGMVGTLPHGNDPIPGIWHWHFDAVDNVDAMGDADGALRNWTAPTSEGGGLLDAQSKLCSGDAFGDCRILVGQATGCTPAS